MREGRNSEVQNRSELPPPRFDEHAHLRAQRVKPIPKSRVSMFFEKLVANGSRSLALIVILGFLTGALIGVSLVGQNTSAPEQLDQASIVNPEDEPVQLQDAEVGVYGIETGSGKIRSLVIKRPRVPNNEQPRAYRFAVIR